MNVGRYLRGEDRHVGTARTTQPQPPQRTEQEPVAWMLTDKNINSLQMDSIQRLIDRLNHAHHTDLRVRINGQDEWFQADWLKHMVRATPPQRKPLTFAGQSISEIRLANGLIARLVKDILIVEFD